MGVGEWVGGWVGGWTGGGESVRVGIFGMVLHHDGQISTDPLLLGICLRVEDIDLAILSAAPHLRTKMITINFINNLYFIHCTLNLVL